MSPTPARMHLFIRIACICRELNKRVTRTKTSFFKIGVKKSLGIITVLTVNFDSFLHTGFFFQSYDVSYSPVRGKWY